MRQIIARAWKDTAQSYGLTWGTGIRSLLVPFATFTLIYKVLGGPTAVSEAWTIGLSGLAAVSVGFLPFFLWNLWLAPYKILDERLDEVTSTQTPPKEVDEEAARISRNNVKTHNAIHEMTTLVYCIDERTRRHLGPSVFGRKNPNYDHDFVTLKEKYQSWFPRDLKEYDMKEWAGRIISILKFNDNYEVSGQRIKQAVSSKSWGKEEG